MGSEVFLDELDGMKGPCAINLHHILTVPKDRLGKRLGRLSPEVEGKLCSALRFVLGCD
ncbi:type II toxin-antitoxin system PemK/MazF family toxin [Bryobacter aggregatus]|uniref:type II toxin-antitoxin system PemK/MazF family toxin n=1 Tax=Bryobacter aggregatus TaxID=360054 RepID=UPI00138DF6D1